MPADNAKVLRPSSKITLVLGCAALAFFLLCALSLLAIRQAWPAIMFLLLGIISAAAAANNAVSKVTLRTDRLEFASLSGKHSIYKAEIESVTWEKGCGVAIRTKQGRWIHIPDLGKAQGVCNSVRAWLKRQAEPL